MAVRQSRKARAGVIRSLAIATLPDRKLETPRGSRLITKPGGVTGPMAEPGSKNYGEDGVSGDAISGGWGCQAGPPDDRDTNLSKPIPFPARLGIRVPPGLCPFVLEGGIADPGGYDVEHGRRGRVNSPIAQAAERRGAGRQRNCPSEGSCKVAIKGAACYVPGRSFPGRGDMDEREKEASRE